METKLIEFVPHTDNRGTLVSIEELKDTTFPIRRVFYVYDVPKLAERGGHANPNTHKLLIAVSGSLMVYTDTHDYLLDSPTKGLLIPAGVKVTLGHFSANCILLVLASEHYDPFDYTKECQVSRLEAPAFAAA